MNFCTNNSSQSWRKNFLCYSYVRAQMGIKKHQSNTILLTMHCTLGRGNLAQMKAHRSSLIPRFSQLFKLAVESNFQPWASFVHVKIPNTCALQSLIWILIPSRKGTGMNCAAVQTELYRTYKKIGRGLVRRNKDALEKGLVLSEPWIILKRN